MAAPTVSALAHVGSGTVNLFAKYYATFTLSKSYTANPDADTDITGSEVWIRADALCTAPSGRVLRVPCYWFQDYTETPGNPATYATTGTAGWRMFTFFDEVGSWTVAIEAEDVDGLTTSGTITVTVTDDGTLRGPMRRKGHLRVDGRGHQIWAFGTNYGTHEGASGLDGTALWARDAAAITDNGGTLARFVAIPRSAAVLEWSTSAVALGVATWYAGLGKVSPKPAKRLDIAMNDAYTRGLYVTLCLDAHEGLRFDVGAGGAENIYMSWHASFTNGGKHPWSVSGGGWIPDATPELFFTDTQARLRYRRKMRWQVARFGGYYNVNWDLVNEADQVGNIDLAKTAHTNATVATAMNAWHIEMARYLKRLDPHRKPIEHSYANGGFANADAAAAFGELDVDSHHHYAANVSQVISWPTNHGTMESINTYGQIADVGEYGVGPQGQEAEFDPVADPATKPWATTAKRDRLIAGYHVLNYIAAPMVYGAAARGWYQETYHEVSTTPLRGAPTFPQQQWFDKLGAFVVGEDWANMWPQPAPVTLTYDTTNLLANAAANAKHVYAYVHNKQLYYDNATAVGSLTNQTGKTLAIASGLTPGSWKYEVWDPKPGLSSASPAVVSATGYATSAAGALTIRLPAFTKAWLVKAWLSDGRRD